MMEQYKKETSQIHAPAELIRKTKEAMWEEEQRLNREGMQRHVTVHPKPSYSKVYKWVFPIAAAAVFCVMLFSVLMMRFGSGSGLSKSDSPMDMASGATEANDMGMQFGSADIAEEMEAAAEEPIDKGGSIYDMAAGAATTAENNVNRDLWVEEVKEIPAFYGDPDTECIAVQDTELYVGMDSDGAWIAYVQVDSKMYVITTVLTDEVISREEFADMAYELLMEERII